MESLSLYDKEEPFDPYTVMLFKGLQVVAFLFFLALMAINPQAKTGMIDSKAEFLITMTWPDYHPDDIDMYVEDPMGNLIWFRNPDSGLMHLDRDDRGNYKDTITVNGQPTVNPLNQEIVAIRGFAPGEYVVNIHHFLAGTKEPVPVSLKIEKVNPRVTVVHYAMVQLGFRGQELTVARFSVTDSGEILGVNTLPKKLVGLRPPGS